MSLLGSKHANAVFANANGYDGPHVSGPDDGPDMGPPRKFFNSGVMWDAGVKRVVMRDDVSGVRTGGRTVREAMERGGRGGIDVDMEGGLDEEWRDSDIAISVEA